MCKSPRNKLLPLKRALKPGKWHSFLNKCTNWSNCLIKSRQWRNRHYSKWRHSCHRIRSLHFWACSSPKAWQSNLTRCFDLFFSFSNASTLLYNFKSCLNSTWRKWWDFPSFSSAIQQTHFEGKRKMLIGSICTVNLQLLKQYYNMPNKVSLDNYGKSKSSERLGKLANGTILHWLFMALV